MSFKFHVTHNPLCHDSFGVHILDSNNDIVTELNTTRYEKGMRLPEAPLQLNNKEAQELMSQLWNLGIRPTDELLNSHAPNSLKAVNKHLEDMRSIAFNKLEVEKPK